MRKVITFIALLLTLNLQAQEVRWANPADSLNIEQLLHDADNLGSLARQLLDTPYQAGTLEADPEMLTVNLSAVDCTTLVEQLLAVLLAAKDNKPSWRDVALMLQQLRYRNGTVNGYASRLHYVSDWIVENASKGRLHEITPTLPGASTVDKTLDFMSRSGSKVYPPLADPEQMQRIRSIEQAYRNHRIPIVKSIRVNKNVLSQLREGDIIAFTTSLPGLDVSHMGIIVIDTEGNPRLLHASSKHGKVVIEPLSLPEYLKRNRKLTGIRVLRPGQ